MPAYSLEREKDGEQLIFRKSAISSMMNANAHPFSREVIFPDQFCSNAARKSSHFDNLLGILSSDSAHPHSIDPTDDSDNESNQFSEDDLHRLKPLIRSIVWPVNDPIRRYLWRNLLTLNRMGLPRTSFFARLTSQTAAPSVSWIIYYPLNNLTVRPDHWPSFVDRVHLSFYHLNETTSRVILQRILWTFSFHYPEVTYAPLIQPLAALLLHYHSENQVFFLINHLHKKHCLCGQTRLQWEANVSALWELLRIQDVRR